MEVKNEEGPNNVESITVRYKLDERLAEGTNFHHSEAGGVPFRTRQVLAVENFEDCPGKTRNENHFAIMPDYDLGRHDNLETSNVTFQEIIIAERSPEEAHCVVLTYDKNEDRSMSLDHSKSGLEHSSGEDVNLGDSNRLAQEVILAEITDEVIEIGDSSDEETLDPVVSSECILEEPRLTVLESKRGEKRVFFTGDEPSSSSATQNICVEELGVVFKAFEEAMDGWYAKLSVHGPLKDCEIMESAQQLARHFNFEFPEDAGWLAMFKNRQKRKAVKSNSRLNHSGVVEKYGQHEGTGDSIENRFKISRISSLGNSYGELEPPSKKARQSGRTVEHLTDLSHNAYFLLPQEDITESPDYPLLLRRAQNASPSGVSANSALIVTERPKKGGQTKKITTEGLHSISVVNLVDDDSMNPGQLEVGGNGFGRGLMDTHPTAEDKEPSRKTISYLESLVLEWYFSLTSQHKSMVSPSIFENKAVEIAQSLEMVSFQPSKMWLKQFMSRHGMWCSISEKRSLFLEPKAGLLKYRFNTEFETWYHVFPTSPDGMLDYYIGVDKRPKFRLKLRAYMVALFSWYVAQSSVVPAEDILIAQTHLAKIMGLSSAHVLLLQNYYRDWCVQHEHFYEYVKEAYNIGSPVLLPQVLKNVSLRWARAYRFSGFTPNQMWMRRFLEINGLCFHEGGVSNWYRFNSTSCASENFERVFRCWQASTVENIKWLRNVLGELVPEKAVYRVVNLPEEPESQLKIVNSFTLCT